ncbi:hypothetical protein A6770_05310 [Nostoc minutum NIES-26]|uniref:Uncharacterized protein n=1 Tax=Nostoc minutum NIES-26 TaxID=1844469 RepID=A0A367Q8F9_9NOSO|nr:hypothetical protein A6770_05310 [Nostoc minutum NIES-26]
MPLSGRLADVETNLELWYETLGSMEQDLARTYDSRAKIAINQQIRDDILPQIRKYQVEYWQLLAQVAPSCTVDEIDACNAIIQVVQEAELITNNSHANYPNEVMQLLHQILEKLNKPEQLASAKVKVAVPLVPGIVSYEGELDTEESLRRIFQPFKRLFKEALKKN